MGRADFPRVEPQSARFSLTRGHLFDRCTCCVVRGVPCILRVSSLPLPWLTFLEQPQTFQPHPAEETEAAVFFQWKKLAGQKRELMLRGLPNRSFVFVDGHSGATLSNVSRDFLVTSFACPHLMSATFFEPVDRLQAPSLLLVDLLDGRRGEMTTCG